MSMIVYWTEGHDVPRLRKFEATEFTQALDYCQWLRGREGVSHVCLSSENPDSVGKSGVDSVENGKTPDGHEYVWKKRRL